MKNNIKKEKNMSLFKSITIYTVIGLMIVALFLPLFYVL